MSFSAAETTFDFIRQVYIEVTNSTTGCPPSFKCSLQRPRLSAALLFSSLSAFCTSTSDTGEICRLFASQIAVMLSISISSDSIFIGVGRFRILGGGGPRFRICGGGQIPSRHTTS